MAAATTFAPTLAIGPRLVQHSRDLLRDPAALVDTDVVQFWQLGRQQFERWEFILMSAVEAADQVGRLKPEAIETVRGNVLAVFESEPVLRAWIALICEYDSRHLRTFRPLALRSFETLLAARLAALRVLTHAVALPTPVVADLDAVRRRCERRTDWLLAALTPNVDWQAFAISPPRVKDFAIDTTRIGHGVAETALSIQPVATTALPPRLIGAIVAPLDRLDPSGG